MPARLAALAILAALALAVPAAPARAAAPTTAPGAASYGLIASNANFVPGTTVAERTARYRRLAEAGVRAIRLDVTWASIEHPGPPLHDRDWTRLDREVTAIRAAGLRIIGLLGYGHPDYSSAGGAIAQTPLSGGLPPFGVASAQYFPPEDPQEFARFAGDAAAHLGRRVSAWEVWNEENGGWRFWAPHEDPAAYGRLLCAAAGALRARTAPGTPVVFGGMFYPEVAGLPGQGAQQFLANVYDADPHVARCFDAVGYHPYAYPFTAPELDVPVRGSVVSAADALHQVTAAHGDAGKPLWITEVGWPTHDKAYGVPEVKQAQYTVRMLTASLAQRVPVVTFYTYGDYADPTNANQEAWFGFFRPDETAKPSWFALRTWTRTFRGTRFSTDQSRALGLPAGQQDLGGRGFALRFRGHRRAVTALWLASESVADAQGAPSALQAEDARTTVVRLPVRARHVTVTGMLGAQRRVTAQDGAIALTLGPSPVYVTDAWRRR